MSMEIKILGSGCFKCETLAKLTLEVVKENNYDASVTKIDDVSQFINHGVLSTPALVINGQVVIKGSLPSKETIKSLIEQQLGY